MADVPMPKSVPCKFDNSWAGKCGKPSDNGWCSKHESLKCVSCGEKAVKSCDSTGSLVCGAPLCGSCTHAPHGGGHVATSVADAIYRRENEEYEATKASRKSKVQRMHESLGVPLNLFELLKSDASAWPIKDFYLLELKHGLMGFFPAIVKSEKRPIITTDRALLLRIWPMLSPRKSQVTKNLGYVNETLGLLYPILGNDEFYQEESKPQKLLTVEEFERVTRDGANPFGWAPGLIGDDMSHEDFRETIEATAREYSVEIPPPAE